MKITYILFIILMTINAVSVHAMSADDMVYEQVRLYLDEPEASTVAGDICDASYTFNVDPVLAAAIFTAESHFDQSAVSSTGAIGIAQLMPDTAAYLGVNPYDEQSNIYGGVAYLAEQLNTFGDYALAEAAYNAGPGAVEAAGGIPNYSETINYVNTVEGIRQDIWNWFGDDSYDMGDTINGDYADTNDANQTTSTVNTAAAVKPKKATVTKSSKEDIPDTLRMWPPSANN